MTDNELIMYHFQLDSINYERYVSHLNYNAKVAREELLQLKPPKIRSYNPKFRDTLIKCYQGLKVHPDDEVLAKFKEFEFGEALLRWFIPLKEIEEQFSII